MDEENSENSIQIDSRSRRMPNEVLVSSWNLRMSAVILSNSQPISLKNKAALKLTAKNQSYNINWNDCKKSPKNHKILLYVVLFMLSFRSSCPCYYTERKISRAVVRNVESEEEGEREEKISDTNTRVCLNSYLLLVLLFVKSSKAFTLLEMHIPLKRRVREREREKNQQEQKQQLQKI